MLAPPLARSRYALLLALAVLVTAAVLLRASPVAAQAEDGWLIQTFEVDYQVERDGTIFVTEMLTVDFANLPSRGIFRELITKIPCDPSGTDAGALFECPEGQKREYLVDQIRATDETGRSYKLKTEQLGDIKNIRIGDPDIFLTGVHEYVITYRLRGALEPFEGHDEFYWNVTGHYWPVPIEQVFVQIRLPEATDIEVICFEGYRGSSRRCDASSAANTALFSATQPLQASQGVTVAAAWPKGVVDVPTPFLDDPLTFSDFFTLDAFELIGMLAVGAMSVAGVTGLWWRFGRDRRYRTLYYLTNDPSEHTAPLFGSKDIVVEFLPPEGLRPAQMGVVLDERADTLDVTATIVDLAVRGYMHITELPKKNRFSSQDWKLQKLKPADDELLPYERRLFNAIFKNRTSVNVSKLKNTFAPQLQKVQKDLYDDALAKQWFPAHRTTVIAVWFITGLIIAIIGIVLSVTIGYLAGRALILLPIALGGLLLVGLSTSMPRRTATGSEALRRVLGFRLYVATAEKRLHEFHEQQNIFARYLPYAMVFECVDKWAKAFEGLANEAQTATSSWYTGTTAFQVAAFSSGMRNFSSSVSSTMTSTPSSSGGSSGGSSGFSGGGFSGGGGGGGGGGRW